MKIKCVFGAFEKIVEWHSDISRFPRAFKVDKEYWDTPITMGSWGADYDYCMAYGKANFATYIGLELSEFHSMFAHQTVVRTETGCECGAGHDRSFPNIHSYWCPKWVKV